MECDAPPAGLHRSPLNDLGRCQAAELARLLDGTRVGAIYSSDAARAVETRQIVAEQLGLGVKRDVRLREVNFGEWEGLTRDEINEQYAGAFAEWDACKPAAPVRSWSFQSIEVRSS